MVSAVVRGKIVEQQMHRQLRAGGGRSRQGEDAVHKVGVPRPVHPYDPGGGPCIGMQPGHIETGQAQQFDHPVITHVLLPGPAPDVKGLALHIPAAQQPPERLVQLLSLQPGRPGVVIPAVFPRTVTGVAHTDLVGHLPLAQPALLAPLQRPSLGPHTLLLREVSRPLDRTPARCHNATVYEQPPPVNYVVS